MLLYADGEEIQGQVETDLKVKVKIVLGFAIPEKCALAQWPTGVDHADVVAVIVAVGEEGGGIAVAAAVVVAAAVQEAATAPADEVETAGFCWKQRVGPL
ncbi:hypothetical protein PMKS-004017 [Pichia membranifaciens]|uniref:Uncharacterized protein n=1 Tax=Pichia membranifaciens TaxID=4926 RepID=A0A1Q2YMA1_9ASCO|nr:hypothetical protein PMKS-004017 [Pichia membranifaciens]